MHATIPKGTVGRFWVHCFSKKFERMVWEVMDICLRVLKKSNKSPVGLTAAESGTVYCSYPILPFGIVACTFVSDNLSRNSCKDEDKYDNRLILLIIPNSKLPVRTWWEVLKGWINYQIQGFSLQLKNGWLEELKLVALFLFKRELATLKRWTVFRTVGAIFCFVKICF